MVGDAWGVCLGFFVVLFCWGFFWGGGGCVWVFVAVVGVFCFGLDFFVVVLVLFPKNVKCSSSLNYYV